MEVFATFMMILSLFLVFYVIHVYRKNKPVKSVKILNGSKTNCRRIKTIHNTNIGICGSDVGDVLPDCCEEYNCIDEGIIEDNPVCEEVMDDGCLNDIQDPIPCCNDLGPEPEPTIPTEEEKFTVETTKFSPVEDTYDNSDSNDCSSYDSDCGGGSDD